MYGLRRVEGSTVRGLLVMNGSDFGAKGVRCSSRSRGS